MSADIESGKHTQAGTGEASWSADPTSVSPADIELTSADAYMLMYSSRAESDTGGVSKPSGSTMSTGGPVPMELENEQSGEESCSLPEQLRLEIEEMNREFESMCWEYTRRREEELNKIAERKKEVRSVLALAPAKPFEEPFYWISTEWLKSWADSLSPP
jgi:ubiquitin carboxyl-terminal hydrolase 48